MNLKILLRGLNIDYKFSFERFKELLGQDVQVIILFSHWIDNSIEFLDCLVTIEQFVEAVPENYTGIIDLCVCHPKPLVYALRKKYPNNIVRFTDTVSTPSHWLVFYEVLFTYFYHNNSSYLDGINTVVAEFKK